MIIGFHTITVSVLVARESYLTEGKMCHFF